jgi:Ca2+-transporting ATPase
VIEGKYEVNSDNNKPWHNLSVQEAIAKLDSNANGLSSDVAARRINEFGYNELEEEGKISPWLLLLEQFKNILIIILLIAVVISAWLGEVVDAIVIFIIILFAAGLGFIQEYRAERAIQALKKMAAPFASVIRGGEEKEIPSRELVPGDVIIIRTGDRIPADARIIEDVNLRTDEAALTGESVAVDKAVEPIKGEADLGDRLNMIYTGTAAVYGRCKAVVVGTGLNTEFGTIAGLLRGVTHDKTPLQINLDKMGKWIAIAALVLCFVLAVMGILRGHPPLEMLIWGVSLAVAAVPEALPAVVTISLALGVNRMVKRHALIRKLPAVETLGSTTVICSDKTGTLTQDQMTLRKIWVDGKIIDISGSGYDPEGSFSIKEDVIDHARDQYLLKYLKAARMCTDTKLLNNAGRWTIKGDPTEGALIVAGVKAGLKIEEATGSNTRIGEIPFTSESKRMIAVYREPDGIMAYSNGAAEVILGACDYVYRDGQVIPLDETGKASIAAVIHEMATSALRVLGTAYKKLPEEFNLDHSAGTEMVFLGLGGMIDPPRPEVKDAIETCNKAGIKTVMITGDHKLTAVAIARELGILKGGKALSGNDLNAMSQKELEDLVESIDVYARVSPEHKLRVVEALASKGYVVAMTGDGINDAPALKKADIGIAMGIKGTDVTKEAADMILTDDNFTSIVAAVEEGRAIFGNIKKYLVYLLSSNIGEILLMVVAVLFGPLIGIQSGILPLIAIQILYVNLATDGLMALALSVDPHSKDIMSEKPHPHGQSIFNRPVVSFMVMAGLWTCIVPLIAFIWALNAGKSVVEAQCICFVTLIIIQFFNAYNCRSLVKSLFKIGIPANKWLVIATAWEICLLLVIVYLPALQGPFNTYSLDLLDWTVAILGAATIVIAAEIYKVFYRRLNQKKG